MATIKFPTIPSKRLAKSITAGDLAFKPNNRKHWPKNDDIADDFVPADFGSVLYVAFKDAAQTRMELMEIDPSTVSDPEITILKRGLFWDGDLLTEDPNLKQTWVSGDTIVEFGSNPPQLLEHTVRVIGAQTIDDIKTFVNPSGLAEVSVATPDPTNDRQYVWKGYVDTEIAAAVGAPLEVEDEGISVETSTLTMNFLGAGVTASSGGANIVDVNIPGGGGGGGGNVVVELVNQVGHGFLAGDWVRSSGTANEYAKAQANSSANADSIGVVSTVTDLDNFELTTEGFVAGAWVPSYGEGKSAHLSTTVAGALQQFSPVTVGQIDKPVGIIIADAASMYVHNYRGRQITSGTSGSIVAVPQQFYSGKNIQTNDVTFTAGGKGNGVVAYMTRRSTSASDSHAVERIDKDVVTGLYRYTGIDTNVNTPGGENRLALDFDATFVYVLVDRDNTPPFSEIRRFDRDLGSETLMTGLIAASGTNNYQGMFIRPDTGQLYLLKPDSVTVDIYDVAGTVLSLNSSFTLTGHTGTIVRPTFTHVNGEIWGQRTSTGNILRWTIAGAFIQEDIVLDPLHNFSNTGGNGGTPAIHGIGHAAGSNVYELFILYSLGMRASGSGSGVGVNAVNYEINTYSIL